MFRHPSGYNVFIGAWFACIHVVDVVEARLIKLCLPSSSSRSPVCRDVWFGSFDQLCWSIGISWTICIRSLVRCPAPRLGFRRCLVVLPCGCRRLFSDLSLGDFAFIDPCRFGCVFEDFVFEFDDRTCCRFSVGREVGSLLEFDCLSSLRFGPLGRSFYDNVVIFEGYLLTNCFLLVPLREDRVFIEDYVAAPDQFPVLRVP